MRVHGPFPSPDLGPACSQRPSAWEELAASRFCPDAKNKPLVPVVSP